MTNWHIKSKKIVALLFCAVAIACLLKLGFWQLDRLTWKEQLLQDIAQYQSENIDLTPYLKDEKAEFRHGFVRGGWWGKDTFMTKPRNMDGNFGYWVLTPLVVNGDTSIMVNRGWVTDGQEERVLQWGEPEGMITVTGTLRRLGVLEEYAEMDGRGPWVLFAEQTTPSDNKELVPVPVAVSLRNDHKQYAIFWFTMAGVLAAFVGFSLLKKR